MGKTIRKDNSFRPKKRGQVFVKDQSWKKKNKNCNVSIDPNKDNLPEVEV